MTTSTSAGSPGLMNRLRDLLIDGMLLALPLGAAGYLLHKVIGLLIDVLAPVAHLLPNGRWIGIAAIEVAAILLLLVLLMLLGVFARSTPGRRVAEFLDAVVLAKIPGYLIAKSVAASFSSNQSESGMLPALVAFDDNTVLGFVVETGAGGDPVTVFVPDAPGAGQGSVVMVPAARVTRIDASTGSALHTMKQRGFGLQSLMRPGAKTR